jgi:hypothetical protein
LTKIVTVNSMMAVTVVKPVKRGNVLLPVVQALKPATEPLSKIALPQARRMNSAMGSTTIVTVKSMIT